MSAFNYGRSKATADRLIKRFGKAGSLQVAGTPTGPAHNQTPGEPIDHPATFAVLDYDNSEIDGTRVLRTDKLVLLAVGTLTVEPTTAARLVEASGREYKIIHIAPVEPGDVTLFYEIQARR